MILCDALAYAQKLGAKKIIDFATLTGACQIALGQTRAGIMTNDAKYLKEYLAAAEKTGEKHWELPMDEEYEELLKSTVADTLNNSEAKYAGTISAAKFLEKFINDGVSWIHCDIAGVAFLSKPQRYLNKEATGFGVRTLVEWLSY
jgi:leucyl aminopeptidase